MAIAVETKCVHHWIIDNSDHGVCKYCDEKRQFARRGDIDWDQVRKTSWVHGKPERVILPTHMRLDR